MEFAYNEQMSVPRAPIQLFAPSSASHRDRPSVFPTRVPFDLSRCKRKKEKKKRKKRKKEKKRKEKEAVFARSIVHRETHKFEKANS